MKKEYSKPKLGEISLFQRHPLIINGKMFDPCINLKLAKPPVGSRSDDVNEKVSLNFSKKFKPEIRFDPSKLPEPVTIEDVPKCPKCGFRSQEMVGYGVMGGTGLCKIRCILCGHIWGSE